MQKYNHLFNTSHLQSNLKKRSLRSGAVTISTRAINVFVSLGSTMILARILSPDDYGINAMAATITGFALMFSNLGLSTATIQSADITHEQVSTLFWINTLIGFLLTLFIAAMSPVVAWFYKTPEMTSVMLLISIVFFLSGLSVQHLALLNRQMRFFAIAKINLVSTVAGILVAISTGYYGFGYWALVFNSLTYFTFQTLGSWILCKWIPGKPQRKSNIGAMVKFGTDLAGFNVINYFARNMDNVLIGRFHGSGALGYYSKAYQLLMMPITNLRNPMVNVAMPALSRLQNAPERYRKYYSKYVSLLAFISMPLVVFMFACSDQLISFLLGTKWIEASLFFKILAMVAFIQPVSSTCGLVLLTTGNSKRYFRWGVVNSIITISFFFIGSHWGAKGVAISYTVSTYLLLYPALYYSFKDTPIRISDFFQAIGRSLVSSFGMGGVYYFLVPCLDGFNYIMTLIICFGVGLLTYFFIFAVLKGGWHNLQEYYSYLSLIFSNK